jgi:hypothetical protein
MVSEKPLSNGLQIDHRRDTFVMHLTKSFGYGGILTKRNNEDIEDMYSVFIIRGLVYTKHGL